MQRINKSLSSGRDADDGSKQGGSCFSRTSHPQMLCLFQEWPLICHDLSFINEGKLHADIISRGSGPLHVGQQVAVLSTPALWIVFLHRVHKAHSVILTRQLNLSRRFFPFRLSGSNLSDASRLQNTGEESYYDSTTGNSELNGQQISRR